MSGTVELTDRQHDDLDTMRGAFGLCVGQLSPSEIEAFDRLCADGLARRRYTGVMGLLGLATAERDYPSTN